MEGRMFFFAIALVAAFALGRFLSELLFATCLRRANMYGESPSLKTLALWRLRNGVGWASPFARLLLMRRSFASLIGECRLLLSEKGAESTDESLSSLFVAISLLFGLFAAILFGNVACLFVVPLGTAVLVGSYAATLKDKRRELVRESLPAAFESMAACFGAGYTLLQAFCQISKDVPGPVGTIFLSAANILEAGGGANDALKVLRESDAAEISFVAVALDVQHQTGGSMKQVLDTAADSVKGELALKRSLRVQTAQAKLSARIVSVMPIALVALFSIASPTFLSPFFQSPAGWAMLVLALSMQLAGVLLVRRALSIGGSL